MARQFPTIFTLILSFSCILALGATTDAPTSFIKSSCKVTTYPEVCIQSLSGYANKIQENPIQLVQTALDVSLARTQSMKVFVIKLIKFKGLKTREHKALNDCFKEMGDTIDRISKSVNELKYLGKGKTGDFSWHMSNVETWVSAALTDENTCFDGFAGRTMDGKVKSLVKTYVNDVAQVTSNALALVNHLAANN